MTSGLQVPFWESVLVTPSHYPRTGRIREQAWSRVLVPRQSGFLDSFSETRLFGAEGFIGPSHFRPSCSVASELRRSEEHTSELQSQSNIVCRLLLEKKK